MLDRLVRRTVLSEADRVVCHHVDDRLPHQCRKPNRRAGVVRKHEERGRVGPQAAVQGHAGRGGRHDMLTNPPPHVTAGIIVRAEVSGTLDQGVVGGSQVSAASDEPGQPVGDRVEGGARRLARGHGPVRLIERGKPGIPIRGEPAIQRALELVRQFRVSRTIGVETGVPFALGSRPLSHRFPHVLQGPVRHQEVRILRPAVSFFGERDFLLTERRAVHARRILLVGRSEADVRADDDQRRPVRLRSGGFHGSPERVHVVGRITYVLHVPAVGPETACGVVGVREVRGSVDRDPVVIIEYDQLSETQVPGERAGFVRGPLHEVTVAAHHVREMIDDGVRRPIVHGSEVRLRHRHPDCRHDPLSERSRGGLDSCRQPMLGVPRCSAVPLAELADFLQGKVVAAEIQHSVQEHRGMSGRQDETIAVEPRRIARIVAHLPTEHVGDGGKSHRRAGMAGVGALDGIDGEGPDRLDGELFDGHFLEGNHVMNLLGPGLGCGGIHACLRFSRVGLDAGGPGGRALDAPTIPRARAVRTSPGAHTAGLPVSPTRG